jgi:[ribosomal protein S5]-alanine N-acetyltransferase
VQPRLEAPTLGAMDELLAASERSEALHAGWVSPPRTPREYHEYLRRIQRATHAGYFIRTAERELAGVINLSEIVRGYFQSAYLGYFALVPHQGKGHMSAGLRLALDRAFGEHRLHRVEANIQPANEASLRLVRRLGFRREGLALRYLRVAGAWRDHERWALTAEEWSEHRGGNGAAPGSPSSRAPGQPSGGSAASAFATSGSPGVVSRNSR